MDIIYINHGDYLGKPCTLFINHAHYSYVIYTSSNHTPGCRLYSDLLDTLADSFWIHQLVLKRCSKC